MRAAPESADVKFEITDKDRRMQRNGTVIWLTGLSGAGKTTLARELAKKLREEKYLVEILDGDEVRENLSRGLGFSREDRDTNVRRIGFVARLLARNGVTVLAAAISPYRQSRDDVRRSVEDDGVRFIEVFARCPLDVLAERDVKGLYKKALAGEIKNFTGISDPYEEPLAPDVIVDSSFQTVEESAEQVLSFLLETDALIGGAAQPAGVFAGDSPEAVL
ncbi:MAG TPA: adenylyl-sulfate kinase [Blastocatellia bacterium]|nr:adenylyl-sulfate kinase [Blastocatellia bacterium]